MSIIGPTIVSAFMANINSRGDRSYEKYIQLSESLLKVEINKVIFIDSSVFSHFKHYANDYTIIIPFYKESNYLYEYTEDIDNLVLSTKNRGKDTVQYMMTMCYKTEFVRKAIEMNLFSSSQFIWLDLGIKHMIPGSDEIFAQKVLRLKEVEYTVNHVRIASIWNPDVEYAIDIYKDISWCFAGSIFGGNIESLIIFADLTKQKCLEVIKSKKRLMWEINIWHLVYKMDRWKFLYYFASHDSTILDNY